jgi:hypothetical protein
LDQTRKNQQSTRKAPISNATVATDDWMHPSGIDSPTNYCFASIIAPTGQVFSDQTGRFLVPSSAGNNYVMIVYILLLLVQLLNILILNLILNVQFVGKIIDHLFEVLVQQINVLYVLKIHKYFYQNVVMNVYVLNVVTKLIKIIKIIKNYIMMNKI